MRVEQCTHLWAWLYFVKSHFIVMFFQKNSSNKFSLRTMIHLNSSSQPLQQCQVWVPSHGVGLKYNQRVVGYSYYICATTAPEFIFCRQVPIVALIINTQDEIDECFLSSGSVYSKVMDTVSSTITSKIFFGPF